MPNLIDILDDPDAWTPEVARTGLPPEEIVVRPTEVRQAGSDGPGPFVAGFKALAQRSLYVFAKAILGRDYLEPQLHYPICNWLQDVRSNRRKLLLLPREHCKTTLVGHALPGHIIIQPKEDNPYFPGKAGCDQRIILAGETELRSKDHLRVIKSAFESNTLLRAFWPDVCWDNPARQSKAWSSTEAIFPRNQEYPDPTIRALGVGAAVTGAHPTCLIKDDLVTFDAANSEAIMHTAIQWHIASRALINSPASLEYLVGTRWSVGDLYQHIIDTDPTVEVRQMGVVEDGKPIYPSRFTLLSDEPEKTSIPGLQTQFGTMFPLLYMNSAEHPDLVDFDWNDIRQFDLLADKMVFDPDPRDEVLLANAQVPATVEGRRPVERHWRSIAKDRARLRIA